MAAPTGPHVVISRGSPWHQRTLEIALIHKCEGRPKSYWNHTIRGDPIIITGDDKVEKTKLCGECKMNWYHANWAYK